MTPAPHTAPMGEQELIALAEELREYTAMKYAGDCKCGKCQLVPRALVDRLYSALRAAASPRLAGSREEIAVLQAISDGYTGKIEHGYLVVENPDATPQSIALGGVDPNLAVSADAILSLLGPAPSESVGTTNAIAEAFIAGATAVHIEWQNNGSGDGPPRGDPEFGEAARDYALSITSQVLGSDGNA